MRVLVTQDYRTLSCDAAGIVADALSLKPDLTLGLPTGNTPLGMYEELVRRDLDFSRATTLNLDEYAGLTPEDPRSFRAYMNLHFFNHVKVAKERIHFPDQVYEQVIQAAGGIDLLILGIGANGHIAFNEPGSSFTSRTRIVDLAPETIGPVRRGITMGIATILDARRILLLASGAAKAGVVRRSLYGPVSESLPASALQQHSDLTVILDKDASYMTSDN